MSAPSRASASAWLRPWPRAPPVTSATRPSNWLMDPPSPTAATQYRRGSRDHTRGTAEIAAAPDDVEDHGHLIEPRPRRPADPRAGRRQPDPRAGPGRLAGAGRARVRRRRALGARAGL